MRARRGIARAAAVVLAAAAAGGAVALVADTASHPPAGRLAGVAGWSGATVPTADARTVTVVADLDGVRPKGCERLTARPTTTETDRDVTIRVDVVAIRAPEGRVCSAVLLSRLPVPVRLTTPIGTRTVRDGRDDRVRRVRVLTGPGS